jgi:hypothetical protein
VSARKGEDDTKTGATVRGVAWVRHTHFHGCLLF